jgi:hypothetical protein
METDGRVIATISSKINERINNQWQVRCAFWSVNESAGQSLKYNTALMRILNTSL